MRDINPNKIDFWGVYHGLWIHISFMTEFYMDPFGHYSQLTCATKRTSDPGTKKKPKKKSELLLYIPMTLLENFTSFTQHVGIDRIRRLEEKIVCGLYMILNCLTNENKNPVISILEIL